MEKTHCHSADTDDDEDYNQFSWQRKRNKRRAIIDDDDDEKVNWQVENAAASIESDEDSFKSHQVENAGSLEDAAILGYKKGDIEKMAGRLQHRDVAAVRCQQFSSACDIDHGRRSVLKSEMFNAEISNEDKIHDEDSLTDASPGDSEMTGYHIVIDDTKENSRDDSNEGFYESQIDPDLLARLKRMKGASKSGQERNKYQRKAKPNAEKMMEIYSESQRLLRDSRVNLPYHEPKPKLLDEFLARAVKKKQEYAGLKRAKDIQKAQIILDKLAVPSPTVSKKFDMFDACQNTDSSSAHWSTNAQPDPTHGLHTSHCKLQHKHSSLQKSINDSMLPDLRSSLSEPTSTRCEVVCKSLPADTQIEETMRLSKEPNQEKNLEVCVPSLHRNLMKSESCEREQTILQCIEDNLKETQAAEQIIHSIGESCRGVVPKASINAGSRHEDISISYSSSPVTLICSAATVSPALESVSIMLPTSRISTDHFRHKLEGLVLPTSPSLSDSCNGTICLDNADSTPMVRKLGLDKLMSRLVQHSKNTPASVHTAPGILDGEKLKQTSDSVVEEREPDKCAAGTKLDMLKQHLGVGMKMKRAETRQRRLQLFALENEEGFDKEEAEELEMDGLSTDDEEMADRSDSDDEEKDDLLNMDVNDSDDQDYNPLLETESRDDDEDNDSSSEVYLHYDVSEDDEEFDRKDRKEESQSCDMENEKKAEYLIKYEGRRDLTSSLLKSSTELTPLSKHLQDTQQQERFRRVNSCSPDLYNTGVLEDDGHTSRPLTDSAYIAQSQMLDADGFLKVAQTQPKSRLSLLAESPDSDQVMVHRKSGSHLSMSAGQIFHDLASQTFGSGQIFHDLASQTSVASQTSNSGHCVGTEEDNMKQLLVLCSGNFGPVEKFQFSESSEVGSFPGQTYTDSQDDDVIDPFHVLSDSEEDLTRSSSSKEKKSILSDSEEDDQPDTDKEDDTSAQFTGLKKKRKKYIKNEFFEEEAELSGSEFDSDENLDLAEENDVLEEEEGDHDLQGVSEEKLRDEVGKLHMKRLQDDDDREVMRFKEMYLQDGDLYSEGGGRMRNFRWKDIEQDLPSDILGQNSGDEQGGEDMEDAHWRKERFDREKFLAQEDSDTQAEDSQVLRLGQFFLQKRDSIPLAQDHVSTKMQQPEKSGVPKRGSFLSRGKETLVKIAQVVKATGGGNSGKSSKNFIFQTVDGIESEGEKNETSQYAFPGKRKVHVSCTQQLPKKVKLSSTNSTILSGDIGQKTQSGQQSSIFQLFQEL